MNLENVLSEQSLYENKDGLKRIFFYRVCGMGMGPAACLLKEKGYHIEGCDKDFAPPLGAVLHQAGVRCHLMGEVTAELLKSFDLIVVGNVVSGKSEEARMIEKIGVPFCSFPSALGALALRGVHVVGICGTHGKTTTTYLAIQVFEKLGQGPGHLVGGVLPNRLPMAVGDGKYFFIESDEYDSSYFHKVSKFRSYHLKSMILTSLEFDHADIFSSLDDIKEQFRPALEGLDKTMVACQEYSAIQDLVRGGDFNLFWYGGQFPIIVDESSNECQFQLYWEGATLSFSTNLLGKKNIENLSAVILYALSEGLCCEKIRKAVKRLELPGRRQELKGFYRNCPVVDDFAHHPKAVHVTIEAVKTRYPNKKIMVVFEPASATARSDLFQEEFSKSFDGVDHILIICSSVPTSAIGLDDMNWERLCSDLKAEGDSNREVSTTIHQKDVLAFIDRHAHDGNLFLILSNSTCLGLWSSDFANKIESR